MTARHSKSGAAATDSASRPNPSEGWQRSLAERYILGGEALARALPDPAGVSPAMHRRLAEHFGTRVFGTPLGNDRAQHCEKTHDLQGFFYAPEWTRTTTDHAVHKALNLVHGRKIRPPASRSSVLCGFADTWDASDDLSVATMLPRLGWQLGGRLRVRLAVM